MNVSTIGENIGENKTTYLPQTIAANQGKVSNLKVGKIDLSCATPLETFNYKIQFQIKTNYLRVNPKRILDKRYIFIYNNSESNYKSNLKEDKESLLARSHYFFLQKHNNRQ